MITSAESVVAIQSLISLLLLWILLYWFYRDYRVDCLRQRLFEIRDELFDYALEGSVGFNHPAYLQLRTTLNGFIRFAERLDLVSILTLAFAMDAMAKRGEHVKNFDNQWRVAISDLSKEQAAALSVLVQRMHVQVAVHLLLSSPILLLTIIPIVLVVLLRKMGDNFLRALSERSRHVAVWIESLDSTALAYGAP
jgi:hypothetical protein